MLTWSNLQLVLKKLSLTEIDEIIETHAEDTKQGRRVLHRLIQRKHRLLLAEDLKAHGLPKDVREI